VTFSGISAGTLADSSVVIVQLPADRISVAMAQNNTEWLTGGTRFCRSARYPAIPTLSQQLLLSCIVQLPLATFALIAALSGLLPTSLLRF